MFSPWGVERLTQTLQKTKKSVTCDQEPVRRQRAPNHQRAGPTETPSNQQNNTHNAFEGIRLTTSTQRRRKFFC